MRRIVTLQKVEKIISRLSAAGKPVTMARVHAALGHRGSMTTIHKLVREALGKPPLKGRAPRPTMSTPAENLGERNLRD